MGCGVDVHSEGSDVRGIIGEYSVDLFLKMKLV
jgi:hypothetical protein